MGKRDREFFTREWDPLGWLKDWLDEQGQAIAPGLKWFGTAVNEYVNAPVKAAETQTAGIEKAGQIQTEGRDKAIEALTAGQTNALVAWQKAYDQQRADLAPYQTAGTNALTELQNTRYTPFGLDQFKTEPGYQFRLAEGIRGISQGAAGRGGLGSNALRAFTEYGQNLGSQEYGNAFNRYQTEWGNKINPLQYLANLGYEATGQGVGATGAYGAGAAGLHQDTGAGVGGLYQQTADNLGNLGMAGSNAMAEGYLGRQNAGASVFATGMNLLSQLLSAGLDYGQSLAMIEALQGKPKDGANALATGVRMPAVAGYSA